MWVYVGKACAHTCAHLHGALSVEESVFSSRPDTVLQGLCLRSWPTRQQKCVRGSILGGVVFTPRCQLTNNWLSGIGDWEFSFFDL